VSFDLYCRLYMHGVNDEDLLRRMIAEQIEGVVSGASVANGIIYCRVFASDSFDLSKVNEDRGFLYYQYTAEVSPLDEIYDECAEVSTDAYLEMLTGLICHLRGSGVKVVAACEFDEHIVQATGWNWTDNSPHHP
jgi:hypothetical protein